MRIFMVNVIHVCLNNITNFIGNLATGGRADQTHRRLRKSGPLLNHLRDWHPGMKTKISDQVIVRAHLGMKLYERYSNLSLDDLKVI